MSHLRLIEPETAEGPFEAHAPLPRRLPKGRHSIHPGLVVEHQRLRLVAAMTETLAKHGYASVTTTHVSERAGVSTSTFYKHYGNLWDCLLAAYVAGSDRLCERIEAACTASDPRSAPLADGIDAALSLLSAEPALAYLLSARPPREAVAIAGARRLLVERLAKMLRRALGPSEVAEPAGLDERMIDATLAFVSTRVASGHAEELPDLGPELTAILTRPRHAA